MMDCPRTGNLKPPTHCVQAIRYARVVHTTQPRITKDHRGQINNARTTESGGTKWPSPNIELWKRPRQYYNIYVACRRGCITYFPVEFLSSRGPSANCSLPRRNVNRYDGVSAYRPREGHVTRVAHLRQYTVHSSIPLARASRTICRQHRRCWLT
jgi:hypothetical protein